MDENFSSLNEKADANSPSLLGLFEWSLDLFTGLLIRAPVTAVPTGFLSWQTVRVWLVSRKQLPDDVGVLVRRPLIDGVYAIRGGVFNRAGTLRDATGWECRHLDKAMEALFEEADAVLVRV